MSTTQYPRLSTLRTGLKCRCPRCGDAPIYAGFLTLQTRCPKCDLDYSFADPADGPAFFVMSAVGLIGMIIFVVIEFTIHPPIWVHMVVLLPLIVAMCLGSLRPFKSWMVAEQYVHRAIEVTAKDIQKSAPKD